MSTRLLILLGCIAVSSCGVTYENVAGSWSCPRVDGVCKDIDSIDEQFVRDMELEVSPVPLTDVVGNVPASNIEATDDPILESRRSETTLSSTNEDGSFEIAKENSQYDESFDFGTGSTDGNSVAYNQHERSESNDGVGFESDNELRTELGKTKFAHLDKNKNLYSNENEETTSEQLSSGLSNESLLPLSNSETSQAFSTVGTGNQEFVKYSDQKNKDILPLVQGNHPERPERQMVTEENNSDAIPALPKNEKDNTTNLAKTNNAKTYRTTPIPAPNRSKENNIENTLTPPVPAIVTDIDVSPEGLQSSDPGVNSQFNGQVYIDHQYATLLEIQDFKTVNPTKQISSGPKENFVSRSPEKIAKIVFAPIIDSKGNYHAVRSIYIVIQPSQWIIKGDDRD